MADRTARPARSLATYAGFGVCAILLASCASTGQKAKLAGDSPDYKGSIGAFSNPESDPSALDPIAAAAFWGTRYDREPTNAEVAVKYSQALRKIGSNDEAVSVMAKTAANSDDNPDVSLEYGKTLVEAGRSFEAVRYLKNAVAAKRKDWRAMSAYGVALDQIGEYKLARQQYDNALLIAPGAASVMNNKGLSFALSGDLEDAEATLRAAASGPQGTARIRQNLALVLAIKGDMREAERLARSDLPPQIADQNIDYFRSLMTQPAYWKEYANGAVDTPKFDSTPDAPAKETKPAPLPKLKEQPKPDEKDKKGEPIALSGTTSPTKASDVVEKTTMPDINAAPELKK